VRKLYAQDNAIEKVAVHPFYNDPPTMKGAALTSYVAATIQVGDKAPPTRFFALSRLGPDGKNNYLYDAPDADNLAILWPQLRNAMSDLGTADNYSWVADTANAPLGAIPWRSLSFG
jgi:hypothetical protein